MKLSKKLRLIAESTGWDNATLIKKVVQAIPKKYADPDGGIPMRYTVHGADAILEKLKQQEPVNTKEDEV
jgi:hypothetical protein